MKATAGCDRTSGLPLAQYAQLHQPDWLRNRLDSGHSISEIAAELGCDRSTVTAAARRYGLR